MENKSAGSQGKKTNGSSSPKKSGDSASSKGMTNAERKYRNSVKYKKQQRQKLIKKASVIGAIAVVLIAAAITAFYFVNKSIYGHIMTIDGEKVSTKEFELLYTVNMTDDKQSVLDILTEYWVVEKKAAEKGFSYTESEKEAALADIPNFNSFIDMYGLKAPKVSDESYIRILGVGSLYTRLQNEIAETYVMDEQEFQDAFKDYLENGKQYYIDTQMKYVITESEEDAVFAREMLATGMEVDEVIINYSQGYNEETGIELIPLSQLGLEAEDVENIMALEVSEYSEVINLNNAFVFFIIDSITIPSDEEVELTFKEEFTNSQITNELYAQIDEWVAATDVVVNQRAFDSIK